MTKSPKYPVAPADADELPNSQRARQEQPTRHYRDDAVLPYEERFPQFKRKPWRRGQMRPRVRMIRESL